MKHVQLHQQKERKKITEAKAQISQGLQEIPDSCPPPNPMGASTPPLLQLKILPRSQNLVPSPHIAHGT